MHPALVLALLLSSLAAPLTVDAQGPEKLYRIGMLERTSIAINAANLDGFRQGLRELGYIEAKNFLIEYRSAEGRDERFPDLATELVRLKVDLILTRGTPAALAAKNATGTIPVVMTGIGDPGWAGCRRESRTTRRECHWAERHHNGDIRETGRAAQRAGPGSRPNRGDLQHE